MKYELSDMIKQISDIELINDLRAVANNLEKSSLKMRELPNSKETIWKLEECSEKSRT